MCELDAVVVKEFMNGLGAIAFVISVAWAVRGLCGR